MSPSNHFNVVKMLNMAWKNWTCKLLRQKMNFFSHKQNPLLPKVCGFSTGMECSTTLSNNSILSMQEVFDKISIVVTGSTNWRTPDYDYTNLVDLRNRKQTNLLPQPISSSYTEAIIPLGSDEGVRESYLDPAGMVHLGKLLEDLDVISIYAIHKHMNPNQKTGNITPFAIYTCFVDQMNLGSSILRVDKDLKLSSQLSWIGKTSVEVITKLWQKNTCAKWQCVGDVIIVGVVKDLLNRGSFSVNSLITRSEEENKLFEIGKMNEDRRKTFSSNYLLKTPPTETERKDLHEIYLSTIDPTCESFTRQILPPGCEWMENAELTTTVPCRPKDANFYKRVFGGKLINLGFELAWNVASIYSKSTPVIRHGNIQFLHPVELDTILSLTGKVVYVERRFIQMRVICDSLNPKTGKLLRTNLYHFTFEVPESKEPLKRIIPRTYGESMVYLHGKRWFKLATDEKTQNLNSKL